MKIVIDIDNETYGRIQALVNADYFEHDICGYAMQRIANGTPYEERPHIISCFNCRYDYKSAADEPCKYCKGKYSEWQAKVEEANNE